MAPATWERDRVAQDDTKKDGPLFIVDNSPGGRSGADYPREWCELARSFDIATGFFEIGSLLELDGAWPVGALDDEEHIANQRIDTYFDA